MMWGKWEENLYSVLDDNVQVQVISTRETVSEWVERDLVTMRWCWWVLAVTPWQVGVGSQSQLQKTGIKHP